jgi:hypothetical protein
MESTKNMMASVKNVSMIVEKNLDKVLSNPYVMAVLKITLALYAAQLAPKLPTEVSSMFNNTFVKIIAVALISYLANKDFQLSIMLAVIFVLGSNVASGRNALESFAAIDASAVKGNTKLIEPKTMIYPGCQNITMQDLIDAFDGNAIQMQNAVMTTYNQLLLKIKDKEAKDKIMTIAHAIGLPYNVPLNEENAPYYATILMYVGFAFDETCKQP